MTTTYHSLSTGDFSQNWSNIGLITANDDWSGVPSIVGYRGDNLTAGTGVDPQTLTSADDPGVVDVNANQTNPNTFATGGVAEFELTDPVAALAGSGTADAPYLQLYMDATGRQDVSLTFNARDLDGSIDNAIQQIAVQYRIGESGVWTNLPAAYIADATTGPSLATLVTPITVTLPSDANNQAQVQIRIMTSNAVGNDEWVGIDDIAVASNVLSVPTTNVSIADVAILEGDAGTQLLTFTVTRSANTEAFSVDFATSDNTATTADSDYLGASGTLNFTVGGALTQTISVTINGDTTVEASESFFVTMSNLVGPANVVVSDAQAIGTITTDDFTITRIYDIQGASHLSLLDGASVTTRGIVTAVAANGFYLQDASGDANIASSDGIFVFTSSAPTVAVGDDVRVTGTVDEIQLGGAASGNLTITEIVSPTATVLSSGNALPLATLIGSAGRLPPLAVINDEPTGAFDPANFDPVNDGLDFYESLEGMLVGLSGAVSVSPTNSFGEIWVVTVSDATSDNARGGVTLSPDDFNPQRVQIDNLTGAVIMPNVHVGATFADLAGVVSYSFSNYEVLLTATPTVTTPSPLARETTSLAAGLGTLTFGSINVENLDPSDAPTKFAGLAVQIVTNMNAPTIVALQEIQDNSGATNDGVTAADVTAQTLINAIIAAGGPTYTYVDVAPADGTSGGEPGGNIRVGFLYQDAVVDLDSFASLDVAAFNGSRDPLVANFTFLGETYTFINNHFTSKGGDNALYGNTQPPVLSSETNRIPQAQVVNDFVDGLLAGDANANVVVLGDLNDFSWSNPLTTLAGTFGGGTQVLFDLADETIAAAPERYSYNFQGNSQELDHIYVSSSVLANVGAFDVVHVNAEFYDQVSDHDPSVASIVANSAPVVASHVVTTDGPGVFDVLATDSDPDDDTLTILNAGADAPTALVGTISLVGGQLVYTHAVGYRGADTVTYKITDGLFTVTGAVNITVSSIPDALTGDGDDNILVGNNGNDILNGLGGNDTLNGGEENDRLDGGTGVDQMTGGLGSDFYFIDDVGDQVIEAAGQGSDDRVYVSGPAWTLAAGASIERLIGTLAAGMALTGNELTNFIYGAAGNDTIDGGAGVDTMVGGAGDDTFLVDHSADRVYEAVGGGDDTVIANVNYALVAGQEIETLRAGVAGLTLIGNALDNHIIGSTGTERLYGGLGNDMLDGESAGDYLSGLGGDDTFLVDSAGDVVIEAIGGGADTVNAAINYALAAGAEIEFLAADNAAGLVLSGNGYDNTIFGGAGVDYLHGEAGNDTIYGRGGSDAAIGGAGDDTLAYFANEFVAGENDQIFGFNDAAGDNDILNLEGAAADYTFAELGSDVIVTHNFTGATIQIFGFNLTRLADQVTYFGAV